MLNKNSSYPKECDCCNPPKLIKNKQLYQYHKNHSKAAKSKEGMSKKQKIDYGNAESNWLMSKMDIFKKAVIKSHGNTDKLEDTIQLLEDDINNEDEELSVKVSQLCEEKLSDWEQKKLIREASSITMEELWLLNTAHYDASSTEEKLWLKSLSVVNRGISEHTDNQGNLHAGIPASYNLSDDDLQFMLNDMKRRVDAIEYEIERRKFLPEKIVYEFIRERFKPVVRRNYSQNYE